ncbi:MAG: Na+/H+ antiporter [Verrucomicrobia bacterium]|nr:Na+/H+ antiporter [Verrucomicrobiota bacterium]
MDAFHHALVLLLLLTVLSVLGRRLPWPMPITYLVGAIGAAFWPGFPRIELDPGFFFLCFVPPLLFADGWLMPLRDFMEAKRPILLLSIGLVVFTTLAVGFTAHWLVPDLPLAMAFALGAVVSPTDAVAVGAITHRLKVPSRLTTILNGESLMNDATGLVGFKFALAAVAIGSFSLREATLSFLFLAVGGVGVGLVIAYVVGRLRDLLMATRNTDALVEVTISLMTPFATYLAAEELGLSSILAVVSAGLYSGWRDPLRVDVETRRSAWAVWSFVLFWLNGLAFILLGLQFPAVWDRLDDRYSVGYMLVAVGAVTAAAVLARLIWVFPGAYLPRLFSSKIRRVESPPSWQGVLVTGWAGMRGTITLAAALSIPLTLPDGRDFPGRDTVILLAFGVIVATLLLQGTTLEVLICKLGLRADDTFAREDRIARIAAVEGALRSLRETVVAQETEEERAALALVIAEYEHRLAELTAEGEVRASAKLRRSTGRLHRLHALKAERRAIDDLWRKNVITDQAHRPLQHLLDHEESMLEGQAGHD